MTGTADAGTYGDTVCHLGQATFQSDTAIGQAVIRLHEIGKVVSGVVIEGMATLTQGVANLVERLPLRAHALDAGAIAMAAAGAAAVLVTGKLVVFAATHHITSKPLGMV